MKLEFFISGQRLLARTPSLMVSDTVNYFSANFSFEDEAWKNLTKYAHFKLRDECFDVQLENDAIPESAGINLRAGSWSIHVHGDRFENGELVQRITTGSCSFMVHESGCLKGSAFPSVTPDLAAELIAKLEELEQNGGSGGADQNGKSAYEIAVDNGFEGSEQEWLESLKGEDGKDGVDGFDGYSPVKGVDYFDGKDGVDGKDGADGYTPIKGTDYFTDADKQEIAEQAAQLVDCNIKPVSKTDSMTQPVGVDSEGKLWTEPTVSGGNGGVDEEEPEDIFLGNLPMTIIGNNSYLLSETNATISTGEGAAQLIDLDELEPYIGDTTYNGGAFEKLGKNTVKVGFANVARNATVHIPTQQNGIIENGKTYTMFAKLLEKSNDIPNNKMPMIRVFDNSTGTYYQVTIPANGAMVYKTFTATDARDLHITLSTVSGTYVAGETYTTVAIYLYEGEHTEIPSGATFDIAAGEKYNTDGYIGSTLSAVNGEVVALYQTNTSGANIETDNGGVIFFGDSILHYSDVVSRYAVKTGKSVVNCAVGGTRMSASRDSSNSYYPLDMANIANAIVSGDFTAQLNSGLATAGLTTLASANMGNYKAMVLEFGTNDFSAKVPFEGEDIASIKGALKHILTSILTKYPNMRIVVLSTLQYVTLGTGTESGVPTHDDGTVWQMNEIIKQVCESDEFCVPFVDMYHAFGQNGITRNILNSDGVHLTSPNGAKRYADILTGKLNALGI